jgi:hypothetical protein
MEQQEKQMASPSSFEQKKTEETESRRHPRAEMNLTVSALSGSADEVSVYSVASCSSA